MSEWQPIETAPKKQWVLVYWARFKNCDVLRQGEDGYWLDEDEASYAMPTHWMKLPEPPSGEAK